VQLFYAVQEHMATGRVDFVSDMEKKREIIDFFMSTFVDYKVKYNDPAVRNVLIWEIKLENMTGKFIGSQPNKK
jgi:hypothetical protein